MNTFEMKTAIHFGADALGRLKEIPYKRVLVITDPFVVKSGMIDMITKPLQAGGKEFDIFCDVVPDAPVGKIAEGVKKFLQYQPEAIVAVGGGSAIDSSKAIREFAKFVPAFAAFEKNRLSLYREAAKEAEEIFDRWADEIDDLDEDYEPDEFFSD
mgnify:CR=1 FL=1